MYYFCIWHYHMTFVCVCPVIFRRGFCFLYFFESAAELSTCFCAHTEKHLWNGREMVILPRVGWRKCRFRCNQSRYASREDNMQRHRPQATSKSLLVRHVTRFATQETFEHKVSLYSRARDVMFPASQHLLISHCGFHFSVDVDDLPAVFVSLHSNFGLLLF